MVGLVLGAALAATPSQGPSAIPWSEVRADIAETICVLVDKLPSGEEAFAFSSASRKTCAGSEGHTPLSRAVDKAIEDADPVLSSLGPGDMPFEFKKGVSVKDNTKSMREAYLYSEAYLRPILSRLPAALSAEDLVCRDCPTFAGRLRCGQETSR